MPRLIGHQLDMLGAPPLPVFARVPRARRGDPVTSHVAAEAAVAVAAKHRYAVLSALSTLGAGGKDQIAARCSLTGVQVCRRLTELEADGLIKATGKSVPSAAGRLEREWCLA